MANIITQKTDVLEQWRLNFNSLSERVGDPSNIYTTDGSDTFIHTTNIIADALNDLNTRKVKRSGDTIASLTVTSTLSVGGACTVQAAAAATNPVQLQQIQNNTLSLSVTSLTASGSVGAASVTASGAVTGNALHANANATTGYVYFGSNNASSLGFDGTSFQLNGSLGVGAITSSGLVTATQLAVGQWGITPSGTTLFISYGGTNVAKIDSLGNLTTKASITSYGTV